MERAYLAKVTITIQNFTLRQLPITHEQNSDRSAIGSRRGSSVLTEEVADTHDCEKC